MKLSTLVRLALAGTATDTLRVALTAISASLGALAVLAAATVLAIRGDSVTVTSTSGAEGAMEGWAMQYSSELLREPGLRPGVALGLLLLAIPVLALAAQCSRLGAPARERRLAALRLAGATPHQVTWTAAAETGMSSTLGAGLGLALYLIGLRVAHRPDDHGLLPLPTDVRLAWWALAGVCAGIPLLATVVAAVTLRRVTVTPFGIVRRTRPSRPRPWPGILIGLGIASFSAIGPLVRLERVPDWVIPSLLVTGVVGAASGVVLGVGWLSRATGHLLLRVSQRPSTLIAARRLITDPWSGSRAFGTLLVAVVIGAGAAGYRSLMVTEFGVRSEVGRMWAAAAGREPIDDDYGLGFHLRALALVDAAVAVAVVIAVVALLVALTERIVARRRAYAALVATGVPRATLGRSALWQTLLPATPAILVALGAGVMGARALGTTVRNGGHTETVCTAPSGQDGACWGPNADPQHLVEVWFPEVTRSVPVPWEHLTLLGGGALSLVLAMVGLSLLFLRSTTDVTELRAT